MDKAIYWYEKSAEQGYQDAQNGLAHIYQNGNGIDKDMDKAIYWYQNLLNKEIKLLKRI